MCDCAAPWERLHRETTSRKNKASEESYRGSVRDVASDERRGIAFEEEEEEEMEEKAAD